MNPSDADCRRVLSFVAEAGPEVPRRTCSACGAEQEVPAGAEGVRVRCLRCGMEFPAAGSAPAGAPVRATIGRYAILREIGRGGMAVVYEAEDTALHRRVALKVLGHATDSSRSADRLHREAAIAAQLSHPGIVGVHEVGTATDALGQPLHYIAMDLVEGRTLADLLDEGATPRAVLLRLLEDVARAVAHAHSRGIVHRDLKPGNILVDGAGRALLADFGLATAELFDARLTGSGSLLGTPRYMAPEQFQGRDGEVGPWTDVYALGAILYEIAAGRPPFGDRPLPELFHHLVSSEPAPPSAHAPGLPEGFDAVCLRALARRREERFPGALEFAEEIARLRDSPGLDAVPARPPAAAVQREDAGEARELARVHLDSGRKLLSDLDRLLSTQDWTRREAHDLGDRARAEFVRATRDPGTAAEAWLESARVNLLLHRERQALAELDRAVAAGGSFPAARLERAILRVRFLQKATHPSRRRIPPPTREAREARPLIEADLAEVRRLARDRRELTLAEAMLATVEGRHEEAARALDACARASLTDVTAWCCAAGSWFLVPGAERQALEAHAQILRLRPRDGPTLAARAAARFWAGDETGAEADIEAALESSPDLPLALVNRAYLRSRRGDLRGAVADIDRVLEAVPDDPDALSSRGAWRFDLGDAAGAAADIERALALAPGLLSAHLHRLILSVHAGRLDAALEDADAVLAQDPDYPEALIGRAVCFLTLGRTAEAIADLDRAGRSDPTLPHSPAYRGLARWLLGDPEAALRDADAALRLAPDFPPALTVRALARATQGDAEAAFVNAERALRASPRSPEALFARALARRASGDIAGARRDLEEARLQPGNNVLRRQVEDMLRG
ncbi:MAG: protein kinase [Planctomycetes bacterium]|nr:protein kinase [Planctomycetota bacterium]